MHAAISVVGLRKSYGGTQALAALDFTVAQGEVCGLLGVNGAGKTTLFQILTGLFVADAGQIRVMGIDIARQAPAALARMGVVFQSPALDLDLTLQQSLSHHAAMQGMPAAARGPAVRAALDLFELGDQAGQMARKLSGGTRRRAEIARALVTQPDLLLLDEPTQGLDPAARHALVRHLRGLARDRGLAILWATHLVEEVAGADRVLVLHRGRLLRDGPPAALLAETGAASLEAAFLARIADAGRA